MDTLMDTPAPEEAQPSTPETKEELPFTPRTERTPALPAPAGNNATGTLKLIALVFMLIDHLGAVVFPRVPEMRILGRIAFPIYCWCMVVGIHYTRSPLKYLGRILVTGLVSQPLYAYVMNHVGNTGNWIQDYMLNKPSIFLTLFLGLAALWGIREKKWLSQIWAPAAAVALATVLGVDYGWKGVLFMILLYLASGSRGAIGALMVAYFLFWGTYYSVTTSFFGLSLDLARIPAWLSQPLSALLRMETFGLLSLPFILIRMPKNVRMPGWVGYCLYPAHLLLVWLGKVLIR